MTQQIKTFQLDIDTELSLNADPGNPLGAATKQYVDGEITNVSGTVGQVSIISSGANYTALDTGLIYYYNISAALNAGLNVIALPIANNSAELIYESINSIIFGNNIFVSALTTTTVSITNNAGGTLSVFFDLIVL